MTTATTVPTLDELNELYRTLKAERTELLAAAKAQNGGKWPDELKAGAKAAGISITDHAASGSDEPTRDRLVEIDAELLRLSDARRLLRKPSRQKAAAERKGDVAAAVAKMTPAEREEFRRALDAGPAGHHERP